MWYMLLTNRENITLECVLSCAHFFFIEYNCLYTKLYVLVSYKRKEVISEMCCMIISSLYVAGSLPNSLFKSTVLHVDE
jgi:hypothetical protein